MPTSARTLRAIAAGFAVSMITVSAASAQDAAKGHATFDAICSGCHSDVKDDNGAKLSLFGVVGRKAGMATGFSYSSAMTASGITWTPDKIDAFITSPATVVPDTAMYFGGLDDPADRANVITYLKTLK
jgi:cytochrome c